VNLVLFLLLHAACPAASPAPNAPGLTGVAKLPAAEAMRLNGEGKKLYRQERWQKAREKYRAALAADPHLLGAALNVACSFSRQRRYPEAAAEAARLIRKAYVPWNREVEEAADLGILQDQSADYAKIQAARREAGEAWGKQVGEGVLIVARTKPPLKLTGDGVLVLGLNQEIFAWIPETGRFFQVTAEDGRVLAFAASADGQRIAYLLAGKLVRPAGGAGSLRGLALRVLELQGMHLGPVLPISDDVSRVQLWFTTQPELKVTHASGAVSMWKLGASGLERDARPTSPPRAGSVVLTGAGVEPASRVVKRNKCRFTLSTQRDSAGIWRVQVSRSRSKPFALDAKYGAGLGGMPFPGALPVRAPGKRKE